MNHQVSVSVGDCGQHVKKQTDSRLDVPSVLVTIDIGVLAVDIFKNKIRLPAG